MQSDLPTGADIDRLTSFLPVLYPGGVSIVERWYGAREPEDEFRDLPQPGLGDVVCQFFRVAHAKCWRDYGYSAEEAWAKLEQPGFIETADLRQIRAILTCCERGERVCSGFWDDVIEDGHIRRILERLLQLRATTP